MSLLNKVLSTAKKADLTDGIHENVIITSVNNNIKKTKDENIINKHCYTTFTKYVNKKAVGEIELSWFSLDILKTPYRAVFDQLEQLNNIASAVTTTDEKDNPFMEGVDNILAEYEVDGMDNFKEIIENPKTAKKLMAEIYKVYVEVISDVLDEKTKLRLKLVYDSKGKYIQQPNYGPVVEAMTTEETKLIITDAEAANKAKSLITPALNTTINISNI